MSPFPMLMLTEVYTLQPFWCIAKIVSGAHKTKNTVKDKCGISLAKDTSADAVFCFVPHILKPPQLFTTDPAECLCKEKPCPGLAVSMNRVKSFSSSGGRKEPKLGALSCSAREINSWALLH